mmetsp:Transcript_17333/g.45244  ORF Transcript_17333/g.45244 Transcript_17333/m.45244 type:complete len:233 (-) Transcript_17333:1314-2012(-)
MTPHGHHGAPASSTLNASSPKCMPAIRPAFTPMVTFQMYLTLPRRDRSSTRGGRATGIPGCSRLTATFEMIRRAPRYGKSMRGKTMSFPESPTPEWTVMMSSSSGRLSPRPSAGKHATRQRRVFARTGRGTTPILTGHSRVSATLPWVAAGAQRLRTRSRLHEGRIMAQATFSSVPAETRVARVTKERGSGTSKATLRTLTQSTSFGGTMSHTSCTLCQTERHRQQRFSFLH